MKHQSMSTSSSLVELRVRACARVYPRVGSCRRSDPGDMDAGVASMRIACGICRSFSLGKVWRKREDMVGRGAGTPDGGPEVRARMRTRAYMRPSAAVRLI